MNIITINNKKFVSVKNIKGFVQKNKEKIFLSNKVYLLVVSNSSGTEFLYKGNVVDFNNFNTYTLVQCDLLNKDKNFFVYNIIMTNNYISELKNINLLDIFEYKEPSFYIQHNVFLENFYLELTKELVYELQ